MLLILFSKVVTTNDLIKFKRSFLANIQGVNGLTDYLFSFQDTSLLDEITEGSSIQFCPTACVSPHLFHCQIATADHKERLEQLMNQLQDCYEVLGVQEQGISNPTIGMNCAAVFAGQM